MTGFGRYESNTPERKITVEMKAVNHRYCEIAMRIPKKLNFFEASIRSLVKRFASRGKIDLYITYEDFTEGKACVKYNAEIAREFYCNLCKISEEFGLDNDIRVTTLARFPEVLTIEEQAVDEKELWDVLSNTIEQAAKNFVETRILEGKSLKEDLLAKLDRMLEMVMFVEERSPQILADYRKKLTEKVLELLGDTRLDESILATELAVYADKICIDEETVRLKSHIHNMKETLIEGINIGRKLDFIAQEMNREANTILSKANDLVLSNKAIDLKTEVEKIREQIQNIE